MYGSNALRYLLFMVKWSHPRVFGKIKVNVLLSENIANLGIFSKLVNNIKNNKYFIIDIF